MTDDGYFEKKKPSGMGGTHNKSLCEWWLKKWSDPVRDVAERITLQRNRHLLLSPLAVGHNPPPPFLAWNQ
jgi:hypothetical protein